MQPRYFIGITLSEPLRHDVAKIQHELFAPGKVMAPLKPHITLLHPNLLQTLAPLHFIPQVKAAADALLPITIQLTHTALFDKRVLHIAVDSPELVTLQKRLIELLPDHVRAQYEIGRPFTPHVTLAQAKPKQKLADDLIEAFKSRLDPLLPQTFEATHLSEFKWLRPRTYRITPI